MFYSPFHVWHCGFNGCTNFNQNHIVSTRVGATIGAGGKLSPHQGCGLGLNASVSSLSRGAVVPRLGLASVEISNASVSPRPRDWTSWSCLGLDTEGLGLGLGLGSKCLGFVGKHFSIQNYAWICHFGSASVLGFPHFFLGLHQSSECCGCGMWPRSWRLGLEAVSRRIVSRLGLASELVRLGLVSRSRALKALVSDSPLLELSTPRSLPQSQASRSRSRLGLD